MVNIFQKKVLILAIYAGEIMMKNGAEVYRVEDTITPVSYTHLDVYKRQTINFLW